MKNNKSKILAIDPGFRRMGVALVENGSLVYHGVKSVERKHSPNETLQEARKIVLRLIKDFRPQVLVFEKAFFRNNRSASLLNVFTDEIGAIGRRRKLKVQSFAPCEMKKLVCGNGWADKEQVARAVLLRYPELKVYLPQDRQWKERYWYNVFDAVALAMVASENGQA